MEACYLSKNNINEVNVEHNKPDIYQPTSIAHIAKSLCKIEYENKTATGFLIKLFKEGKEFFCMMTSEHVITREMIKQRKVINFYYNSINAKTKEIKLDPYKRFIQDFVSLSDVDKNIDINIDAIIIEILPEDNIPKEFYLSLNEDYINNYDGLKGQEITILQYPEGNLEYSYCKIKKIDKFKITYIANTEYISSGSPIFLKNTVKVIGIVTGRNKEKSEYYGYCIGPILNFLQNFSDNNNVNVINNIKPLLNINDIQINNKSNNQLNKMTLLYKFKENSVQIFGEKFVNNNKNNCYLLIDERERELCSTIGLNEINVINGIFKIILVEKNTITNMGFMFSDDNSHYDQSLIISLPDTSEWNTSNVTNMEHMFSNCSLLEYLPDLSKWNTTNVTNMEGMFSNCSSLKSLPDISEWNTANVTNMNFIFWNCGLLKSFPDISKWNTTNVTEMSYMFAYCTSLKSLPDISEWNITNVKDMSWMFYNCISLKSFPDISKWNTTNVTNMCEMFCECGSLISLPDISKWNTTNVTIMHGMFSNCSSLISLPDISEWNMTNVTDICCMFYKCSFLISLPDISKWDTTNITSMACMFCQCCSLISLPDISKWKLNKEVDKEAMFNGCDERIIPEKFKESNCLIY